MNDEIKEILDKMKNYSGECHSILAYSICGYKKKIRSDFRMCMNDIDKLLDYITNLQSKIEAYELFDNQKIANLQEENKRLKKISHKMHLWIFLNCGDEQKVYDELGLTDEENAMLGYSGQFRMGSDKE